jgi:hypothetical protein
MAIIVRRPIPSRITVAGSGAGAEVAGGSRARKPVPGVPSETTGGAVPGVEAIPSVPSGSESGVNGADAGPRSLLSGAGGVKIAGPEGPDNGVNGSLSGVGSGVHGARSGDDNGSAWATGTIARLSIDSNTNVRAIPLTLPRPFTPWLGSPSEDLAPLRSIGPRPNSKIDRLIPTSGGPGNPQDLA